MKNIKFTILPLTFIALVSFISCVKPAKFSDNYTTGHWIQYSAISGTLFNSNDLSTQEIVVDVAEYHGEAPAGLEVDVVDGDGNEYKIKDLTWGENQIVVTAEEIITAMDDSYTIDDFITVFPPGSVIQLIYYPIAADGQKIVVSNTDLGESPNYSQLNNNFNITVYCPFNVDEMPGTYKVTRDQWQDLPIGALVTIEAVNDSTFNIIGYPNPTTPSSSATYNISKVIITDLDFGTAKIESNINFGNYTGDAPNRVWDVRSGTGTVYSCVGKLSLNFVFGIIEARYTAAPTNLRLEKVD